MTLELINDEVFEGERSIAVIDSEGVPMYPHHATKKKYHDSVMALIAPSGNVDVELKFETPAPTPVKKVKKVKDPEPEKSISLGDLTQEYYDWFKRTHTDAEVAEKYPPHRCKNLK